MCILQALVHEDPSYVVKRYESRKYAIDESVTSEYLKVGCLGLMSTKKNGRHFLSFLHMYVQYMYFCIFTYIYISFMLCCKVAAMLNITPRHLNKGGVVVFFLAPWYFIGTKSTVRRCLGVWDDISQTAKVKPSAMSGAIQIADEKLLYSYCNLIWSKKK